MLDKMKQFMEMKRKMDDIKKELGALVLASEDKLVKIEITGAQEIKAVTVKVELSATDKAALEASLTDTMNRAIRESHKAAAHKMSALGSIPGLT
ncbi:MAG: YbaB/EbfC family nucleoid-associated protein [Elusimicrobiota bacterium]